MSFVFVLETEFSKTHNFQMLILKLKFIPIIRSIIPNQFGFHAQTSQLCITSNLFMGVFQKNYEFKVIQNAQQVLKKIVVKNPLKIDSLIESAGLEKTSGIPIYE